LRTKSNVVLLDPDVADVFPTDEAVNAALRGILHTAKEVRKMGGLPNKTLQRAARKARRG